MLRTEVAESLRREFEEDGYLFPDYEGYCFANVPHTVSSVLGADTGRTLPDDVLADVDTDGVETVLVVLVDGFGFEQWRRVRDQHPFLDRLTDAARVTPLTSIYPSETAAAMNTFHSGALPADHGVVGWNVYEPTVDVAFEALPFQTKDGEEPPLDFEDVADADALYPGLADAGIEAHHVVPFETSNPGTTTYTYETLPGFSEEIRAALDASHAGDDPAYCFAYLPTVDAAAHEHGTEAADYRETVGEAFAVIEDALAATDDAIAEETLLVVTADHGHVNTDPERNVDLDEFDWLVDALARHEDGSPIRFAGSPRNVHLHLREDGPGAMEKETVAARLREDLDALAFTDEDALDRGLFGDVDASETFRRRLGDVVLTHRNLGTWFGDAEPDELGLVGMHGGLLPAEMLVPFAVARADELAG